MTLSPPPFNPSCTQYGHVFVGGLWGHYARAAYFLMAGQLGFPPPYVSLDGGGALPADRGRDGAAAALLWQVRLWPAWKCVMGEEGPSHPGTPIPSRCAGRCAARGPKASNRVTVSPCHPPFLPVDV